MGEVINFDDMPEDERRVALTEIFGSTGWGAEAVAVAMGESAGDLVPVEPDEPIPLPFEEASSRRAEFKFIQDPATGKLLGSEPEEPAPDPGDYPGGEDDEDYQAAYEDWQWNDESGTGYSGELEEEDMFGDEVLPDLPGQILTSKQFAAVDHYTATELHRDVNDALRRGDENDPDVAEDIALLDSAMVPAAVGFTAFRGISERAVKVLVGKDGFEVGQTFKDGSFQSTTTNPNVKLTPFMGMTTKTPVLLEIDVPQGHDILNVSGSGFDTRVQSQRSSDKDFTRTAEREVILGRDTEYTVTGVSLISDRNHGVVQVVRVTASQGESRATAVDEPVVGESGSTYVPIRDEDFDVESMFGSQSSSDSLDAIEEGRVEDLDGADLSYEDLGGFDLFGASLRAADLERADLQDASLVRANLLGASLKEANLVGADLTDANLSGADLTGADLTDTVLSGVVTDDGTKWPDGFALPAASRSSGRSSKGKAPAKSPAKKSPAKKSPAKKAPAKKAPAKKSSAKKAPAKRKAK